MILYLAKSYHFACKKSIAILIFFYCNLKAVLNPTNIFSIIPSFNQYPISIVNRLDTGGQAQK